MKGGKGGRARRPAGGGTTKAVKRGKPEKAGAKRPAGAAPRKGSRKKSFGASSSTDLDT